jgi:hypothetical protein
MMKSSVKTGFNWVYALCAALCVLAVSAHAQEKKVAKEPEWQMLFDGKTLKGWKPAEFPGGGAIEVAKGLLQVGMGESLSGVTYTNKVPTTDYEIEVEGKKIQGSDFFCALTFPVGTNHCSFVLGGWGGAVVGISSIDLMDASENETTKYMKFEKEKWYKIRVKVTAKKLEAWIDGEKLVDVELEGKKISMRSGDIEQNVPFGIASYQTESAFKSVKIRELGK